MSLTFYPALDAAGAPVYRHTCGTDEASDEERETGELPQCDGCDHMVNMSNARAAEVLAHIGLLICDVGEIESVQLKRLCASRLAQLAPEPAIAPQTHGRLTDCGRRAGYLRERTSELLALCDHGSWIVWS